MLIKYHNYKFDPTESNAIKYIPSASRKLLYGKWFVFISTTLTLMCYPKLALSIAENFYPLEEQVEKRLAKKEAYETLILSKNQFKNNVIRNSSSF